MVHLENKMKELIKELEYEGFNDVRFHSMTIENAEGMNPKDYVIACNMFCYDECVDNIYFDVDRLIDDLHKYITEYFTKDDPDVKVYYGCQEVEVMRDRREGNWKDSVCAACGKANCYGECPGYEDYMRTLMNTENRYE